MSRAGRTPRSLLLAIPLSLSLATALLPGCVSKKRFDALQASNAAMATQIQEGQTSLESCKGECDRLTAELAATEKRAAELTTLSKDLEGRNADLKAQLETVKKALETLGERSSAERARKEELEKLVGSLQANVSATEKQALEARARLSEMEAERQRLQEEQSRLKAEAARLASEKARLEAKTAEYDQLVGELEKEIKSGEVTISELKGKLTVNLSNAILFDSGEYKLKKEGEAALAKVAGVLATVKDREIRVEGHTDDDAVHANASYGDNWGLSALRASTVASLLVREGVDPRNVAAVGYGAERPLVRNDSPEHKAANRRTEIVLAPRLAAPADTRAPAAK